MPVCFYYHRPDSSWAEETVYVLTSGKEQSASVSNSALRAALGHLMGQQLLVPGRNFIRLHGASDGCACQYKCGEAVALNRAMMREPQFAGVLYYEHTFGGTSHFKGRHDGEGGALKAALSAAVLNHVVNLTDLTAAMLATVEQFVVYANDHLTIPASQLDTSQAHRDRSKVQRRGYLVVPPSQPMLNPPSATGIHEMHRAVYFSDPAKPAYWSPLSCTCSSCIIGDFKGCKDPENYPLLTPCEMKGDSPEESAKIVEFKEPTDPEQQLLQTIFRLERPLGLWSAVVEKRRDGNARVKHLFVTDILAALDHLGQDHPQAGANKAACIAHAQGLLGPILEAHLERADVTHAAAMEGARDMGWDELSEAAERL